MLFYWSHYELSVLRRKESNCLLNKMWLMRIILSCQDCSASVLTELFEVATPTELSILLHE